MTDYTTHYFTFGTGHLCRHPKLLANLANGWIEVLAEENHRGIFVQYFTSVHMDAPNKFAFEYEDQSYNPSLFPEECFLTLGCFTVPAYDEDPNEDMINFLHELPIEWDGDECGINFYNPGEEEPLLVVPGDTFVWDGEKVIKHATD